MKHNNIEYDGWKFLGRDGELQRDLNDMSLTIVKDLDPRSTVLGLAGKRVSMKVQVVGPVVNCDRAFWSQLYDEVVAQYGEDVFTDSKEEIINYVLEDNVDNFSDFLDRELSKSREEILDKCIPIVYWEFAEKLLAQNA